MSFVSVIATEKFITVMSDGLVYNMVTGEELNENIGSSGKSSMINLLLLGEIEV